MVYVVLEEKGINNWLVDRDPPALLILEQKTSDTYSLDGFFLQWLSLP